MAEDAASRTEQATPKRREEARSQGQVVQSPEIGPVAALLVACTLASAGAPQVLDRSRVLLRGWLANLGPVAAGSDVLGPVWLQLADSGMALVWVLVPLVLALATVGVAVGLAQVGWGLRPNLLVPDPGRISPAKGWQRLASLDGVMMLVKAVIKITVVSLVAYRVLRHGSEAAIATPDMVPAEILALAGASLRHLLLVMAVALGVLGALDYAWARWRFETNLKMSRHEVKDEQKESEGDPQVKARFKRIHRELARRRMLTEVRRADVVLTNPTHYAVALRYRPGETAAPRVVAKGAGEIAQKIKETARAAGVPIVERRALARALYRAVEVGSEIPPTLYRAVAEILAYIYSLRGVPAQGAR